MKVVCYDVGTKSDDKSIMTSDSSVGSGSFFKTGVLCHHNNRPELVQMQEVPT